jgi:hypothetical protein
MKTASSRKSMRGAGASSELVVRVDKVDFRARLRAVHGSGVLKQTATEMPGVERGER